MLDSCLGGEFLLHVTYWVHFFRGSFYYISHAGFTFMSEVSLTHPVVALFLRWEIIGGVSVTHHVLDSFLDGEFLLHIPSWIHV